MSRNTAGIYVPTATLGTNLSASVGRRSIFLQIGNTVLIFGEVDLTPILASDTVTRFRINLPVPSNFDDVDDATGQFSTAIDGAIGILKARIQAPLELSATILAKHTTTERYTFQALYTVKPPPGLQDG
jgi:hypothetical protein